MKKLYWITGENFLDVDLPILPIINKHFELFWIVVFTKSKDSDFNPDYIYKYAIQNNLKIKIINLSYRLRDLRIILEYLKLMNELNKISPKVLYVNYLGMPYFFPLLSIFTKKKNIIYAAHDVVDHKNVKKRKLIQLYKRFIFKTFGHFHLFSRTQQELFLSLYPEKNTFYAPLMLKDFGEPKLKNRDDKINFLFFGIIRENKGLNLLIEAGNKLAKHYSDKFKITIAGKCYNWDYYSNVIEHPENFELTIRTIQNLEIPDLFNSADYLILPYLDVTQSGPLLIAYNYNLPVIASNHKGFSEYIKHGDNGYLFETENGHELYGIMKGIIRAKNFQINQIKKNLSEFVEKNISLNLISKNYIDFFNSL